jgi:hypothetical protein
MDCWNGYGGLVKWNVQGTYTYTVRKTCRSHIFFAKYSTWIEAGLPERPASNFLFSGKAYGIT